MKLLAALSLALLASCTSLRPYGPLDEGVGYSSEVHADGTIEVTYVGESHASLQRVEDLCMLRCAEVTLDAGRDEFHLQQLRKEHIAEERWVHVSSAPVGLKDRQETLLIPTVSATIVLDVTNAQETIDAAWTRRVLRDRYRLDGDPFDDEGDGFFID